LASCAAPIAPKCHVYHRNSEIYLLFYDTARAYILLLVQASTMSTSNYYFPPPNVPSGIRQCWPTMSVDVRKAITQQYAADPQMHHTSAPQGDPFPQPPRPDQISLRRGAGEDFDSAGPAPQRRRIEHEERGHRQTVIDPRILANGPLFNESEPGKFIFTHIYMYAHLMHPRQSLWCAKQSR
jgi:hypothetical protein